jgi:hypothetical protein
VANDVTRSSGTPAAQTDTDSILGISTLLHFWVPVHVLRGSGMNAV